jgi:hypothetical protein
MSKCIGQECTQTNAKLECPGCIKYELPSLPARSSSGGGRPYPTEGLTAQPSDCC